MTKSATQKMEWKATLPLCVGGFALLVLVGFLGVWSVQTRIAGAVIASGTVQIETNRQIVQHPDGGIVGEILAKDGDVVDAGDVLLRFEDSQLRSQLTVVEAQLFEVLSRKLRLRAERDGLERFPEPEGLLKRAVATDETVLGLIEGQKRLFFARAVALQQNAEQITEQISQTENEIAGAYSQIAALETQQELIVSELRNTQDLFDRGLTPISRVSALKREEARIQGELGVLVATVAQLKGQIAALKIERLGLKTSLREDAISLLRDLEFNEVELNERRLSTLETLSRMELRAPVGGEVHGSRVFTLKEVVSPAEPILYIVPEKQPKVVSARVDPVNIDQVEIGQKASLRFVSFEQRITPELIGHVTKRSADVFTDELTGASYYLVELLPAPEELEKLQGQKLLPGMPVEAFIQTSLRSPLSYLLKPVTDYFSRALRE